MASITEASLREAITQRLGAIHVEVTDMSGTSHYQASPTLGKNALSAIAKLQKEKEKKKKSFKY